MAKVYYPNGDIKEVFPKNKKEGFTCKELYSIIGCSMVQPVFYKPGYMFICDEEFRLKDNWQASRNKTVNDLIIEETGDDWDLAGIVVICSEEEFK